MKAVFQLCRIRLKPSQENTLYVLPKISFKLTQSIHVALQKWFIFQWLKPIKGKLDIILEIMKKKTLGGATSQKSQKESKTHDISTPLL